jgi:SAM-dependent MidA family methyltransferase
MMRPFHTAWAETANFYLHHRPSAHFRTSSRSSSRIAQALATIVLEQWERLRGPDNFTVTDVGADDGHLLDAIRAYVPAELRAAMRWRAVDLIAGACEVEWVVADVSTCDLPPAPGVLFAQELLDDIPCTIVENDEEGRPWVVGIDADGVLTPLAPLDSRPDLKWLDTWWPDTTPFAMREVGRNRDEVWRRMRASVTAGAAIAIDYGHMREERLCGRWAGGTVRGFRAGRVVRPIPNGRCNITAHVAMDSLAPARLLRQSEVTGIGGAEGEMLWLIEERGLSCAR